MQYTGLKDKNGKEIYEGDILRQYPGFGCEWKTRDGFVKYMDASFWLKIIAYGLSVILDNEDCQLEIMGNIYENPELFKEENK